MSCGALDFSVQTFHDFGRQLVPCDSETCLCLPNFNCWLKEPSKSPLCKRLSLLSTMLAKPNPETKSPPKIYSYMHGFLCMFQWGPISCCQNSQRFHDVPYKLSRIPCCAFFWALHAKKGRKKRTQQLPAICSQPPGINLQLSPFPLSAIDPAVCTCSIFLTPSHSNWHVQLLHCKLVVLTRSRTLTVYTEIGCSKIHTYIYSQL